jgi:PAS domain S-box-containing protein
LHATPGETVLRQGQAAIALWPHLPFLLEKKEHNHPMSLLFHTKEHRHSCRLSLLALLSMAVVVSGLFMVTYSALHSRQEAEEKRMQCSLEDRARSIGQFFNERENDMRGLAAFIAHTNMFGALPTKPEGGDIERMFAEHNALNRLGDEAVYARFSLIDSDGRELAGWPAGDNNRIQDAPVPAGMHSAAVLMGFANNGLITFTCPIYQNDSLRGLVRGAVRGQAVMQYFLTGLSGSLTAANQTTVVFQSQSNHRLAVGQLRDLMRNRTLPAEVDGEWLRDATPELPQTTHAHLFFATVPGRDFDLYHLETTGSAQEHQEQRVFAAGMALFSLGVFGVVGLMQRAVARRQGLEQALQESRALEQAAAKKKAELELIFEGAQLGSWDWDVTTSQVAFNARFFTMLGYEPGELPSCLDTWKELLHPDDAGRVYPVLERHLKGLTPLYSSEHRLRHKSGQWIWVLDAGKVLERDASGRPLRALGVHLDVTERKQGSQLLARAKEESDAIIRNFLDTLIVVSMSLQVVRVNQTTCELLGYSERGAARQTGCRTVPRRAGTRAQRLCLLRRAAAKSRAGRRSPAQHQSLFAAPQRRTAQRGALLSLQRRGLAADVVQHQAVEKRSERGDRRHRRGQGHIQPSPRVQQNQ